METNSSFKKEICESFSSNSDDYDGGLPQDISNNFKKHLLNTIDLTSGSKVLDLNCRAGAVLSHLIENSNAELCGIDRSYEMVEICKSKIKNNGNITIGQTYNIPYEDEKFDFITSAVPLQYFEEPIKSLEEIYRVLKVGGKVILEDYYFVNPIKNFFKKLITPKRKRKELKAYSPDDIKEMLAVIGFKEVFFEKDEMFSYIIIASK